MAINKIDLTHKKRVSADQVLMLISFVTDVVNILIAAIFYGNLQPQIPIFYSIAEQAKQLANKEWIFLLPLIGLAIAVVHSLIITFNRNYDEFLWRLFAIVTLVFEIMLLAINLRIIWLIS